ncbi:MAG: OmpH family outer membrane protein [Desulfatibacillaceae bacterium]
MYNRIVAVSVFIAMALICGSSMAADIGKIGVVDMQRVLDTSAAGKAASAELKTRGETMEAEMQKKGAEIEELRANLERKAMVMNREKREEAERQLRIEVNDMKSMQKRYLDEFRELETRLASRIRDEAFAIVDEMGRKQGFSMILEKREAGIIYYPSQYDLTDELIKEYNERYSGGR